jgi:hypothetical protein
LPKGTTTKTGPDSVTVNRNVNLGNTKHTGGAKTLNNPNVGGNLNVNRNATIPKGNVGAPGVAKGAAKGPKPKGQPQP